MMVRRSRFLKRCPLERKRRQKLVRVRKLVNENGAIHIIRQPMKLRTVNPAPPKIRRRFRPCAVDRKIRRSCGWLHFDLRK